MTRSFNVGPRLVFTSLCPVPVPATQYPLTCTGMRPHTPSVLETSPQPEAARVRWGEEEADSPVCSIYTSTASLREASE